MKNRGFGGLQREGLGPHGYGNYDFSSKSTARFRRKGLGWFGYGNKGPSFGLHGRLFFFSAAKVGGS
eukprot:6687097-Karenia_brevis.AAC.1